MQVSFRETRASTLVLLTVDHRVVLLVVIVLGFLFAFSLLSCSGFDLLHVAISTFCKRNGGDIWGSRNFIAG